MKTNGQKLPVDFTIRIKEMLVELADRAREVIDKAVTAFFEGDTKAMREVIEHDDLLDRLEVELEEYAITLLEEHRPVGFQLRFIVSALKINNDLERMADHAVEICEASMTLGKPGSHIIPALLPLMIDRSRDLVNRSIGALVEEDLSLSLQIRGEDVVIDRYAAEILQELSEKGENYPSIMPKLMRILLVVRSVERVADLATNIAESIIYLVEGTIVRHSY